MQSSPVRPTFRNPRYWTAFAVSFLTALAGASSAWADCACGVGKVKVKFRAEANLIKGTTGEARITFAGTSAASSPNNGGPLPYEPPSGEVGAAATTIRSVRIKQNTIYGGTLSVTPTGVSTDYPSSGCMGVQLTALFEYANRCGLTIEFKSDDPDLTGKTDWHEVDTATFNYYVPAGREIPFKMRARKRDESKVGGQVKDPSHEESGVNAPSIPESDTISSPNSGGQPSIIDPPFYESDIPISGGVESRGFDAGSFGFTSTISPSAVSLANLTVSDLETSTEEFHLLKDGSNHPRQVVTPAGLYDVQTVSGGGFSIKFYQPDQFDFDPDDYANWIPSAIHSGQNPGWTVTYTPVAAALDHLGGIRVVRQGANGTTSTREVLSLGDNAYRVVEEGIEATDYYFTFTYDSENSRWYRHTLESVKRNGVAYSRTERSELYQVVTGWEGTNVVLLDSDLMTVSESIGIDGSSSLTTTWTPDPDFIGKPASVVRPDGSWESYSYWQGSESGVRSTQIGLLKRTLEPWKSTPASPVGASATDSVSTDYTYQIVSGEETKGEQVVSTSSKSPGGSVTIRGWQSSAVAPTSTYLNFLQYNGLNATWRGIANYHVDDNTRNVYASSTSSSGSLRQTSVSYNTSDNPGHLWTGRTMASLDPSGDGTITGYMRGSFNSSTGVFTADSDPYSDTGDFICSISLKVRDFTLPVSNEAAKVVEIEDLNGRVLRRELWIGTVYTGYVYSWSKATVSTWEYTDWPDGSLKEVKEYHDGRQVSRTLQVSGTTTEEWNEEGIKTTTETDGIGRVVSVTTEGAAALGSYPAQPDRVTSYAYVGRTTTTTQSGGGLAVSTVMVEDLAGRTIREYDPVGAVTVTTYPNGGRDTLTTLPGGPTRLVSGYLDGRTASITGSAVVDEVYGYTVLTGGLIETTRSVGDLTSSTRSIVTVADWAGRTISISTPKPQASGWVTYTNAYATSTYSQATERLVSRTFSVPYTMSPVSIERPTAGSSLTYSGYDVNGGGLAPSSSDDRVASAQDYYESSGGFWWQVSVEKTYDDNSDTSSAITTVRKRCLHGVPGSGLAEKTILIKPAGETITTTAVINSSNKTRTVTADSTASTVDAVSVTFNGLLVAQGSFLTSTATVLGYDGLGRQILTNHPHG